MHFLAERHFNNVITAQDLVIFDQPVCISETDMGTIITPDLKPDFIMGEENGRFNGQIQFTQPGKYLVKWFTTQMRGLSSDGNYFCLKRKLWLTPPVGPGDPCEFIWVSLNNPELPQLIGKLGMDYSKEDLAAEDSANLHCSNSRSIPLEVFDEDVADPNALFTIALFNATDTNVKLSGYDHNKSALLIFGANELSDEIYQGGTTIRQAIEQLSRDLDAYENNQAMADLTPRLKQLAAMEGWQDEVLFNLGEDLEAFQKKYLDHYASKDLSFHKSPTLEGIEVCTITSGYAYNFWAAGIIESDGQVPAFGQKLHLVASSACTPLQLYLGEACICPCLCKKTDPDTGENLLKRWIPIYFDNTGVYLKNTFPEFADCVSEGVTLSFTQTLILS